MSIEMDSPITPLEKADAAANLVEQMRLAHMMRDETRFQEMAESASTLLWDVVQALDEGSDDE